MPIRSDLDKLFTNTEVTYNGYTLPPVGLHVHTSESPVYDDSKKSLTFIQVRLIADFIISFPEESQTSLEAEVARVRRILNKPGQTLVVKGYGLGNVNLIAGQSLDGGPRTASLDIETLHSSKFAHVVWNVEFTLPGCSSVNTVISGTLLGFDYSIKWSWDDLSGGTRTQIVSGVVHLYAFIQGTKYYSTIHKATELLEKKFPRIGYGFDRAYSFDFSSDRKQLMFTITDTEKLYGQVASPEMMADLQLSQRLHGSLGDGNYTKWKWDINASVLVFKPRRNSSQSQQKQLAFIALGRIIVDRLLNFKNKTYYSDGENIQVRLFVEDIDIQDYITTNAFDYNVSGTIYCTTEVLFDATGMFDPLTGTTSTWKQRDDYIKSLGIDEFLLNTSGSTLLTGNEDIINVCNQVSSSEPTVSAPNKPKNPKSLLVEDEKPTPETSWLDYQYRVDLIDYVDTVVNIPLSDNPPRVEKARDAAELPSETSPVSDLLPVTSDNALTEIVTAHNPTAKVYKVVLSGKARRLGYRINAPNLLSYGGMTAVKIGQDEIVSRESPSRKDIREYYLSWKKYYVLVVPDPTKAISKDNPNQPQHDRYITDVPKQFKNRKK